MSQYEEQKNELAEYLADVDADEFAEKLDELTSDQIDDLHNMYKAMRADHEMRTVITFALKRDIAGWLQHTPNFIAKSRSYPYKAKHTV